MNVHLKSSKNGQKAHLTPKNLYYNLQQELIKKQKAHLTQSSEEFEKEEARDGKLAQLYSFQKNESLRIRGVLNGQQLIALIDSSATQNFIDEGLVARRGLQTQDVDGFRVMVADGFIITCTRMIPQLSLQLGSCEVKDDFYVVSIGDTDVVLDIQWLRSLGEITPNFQTMELKFKSKGKNAVLRGISNGEPQVVSFKCMEKLFRHD